VSETDAELPRTGTVNTSSASSSGPATTVLVPQGVAALPVRRHAQKRVLWSFEAETRWQPSGWKVRGRAVGRASRQAREAAREAKDHVKALEREAVEEYDFS
jgi:hypothetical protein